MCRNQQGGPEAVLAAISVKDEEETSIADNMEIEATLVPLSVTTEIVYEENIYSSDDTEIVNQDSTEVVTDFTEEYDNSNDIVTISPVISEDEEISNEGNDVEVVETEMIPPKENDEETSDENETVITNANVVEEEVATQAPANLDISVSEPEEEELIGDNNDTKNMETSSDDEEELVASEEENEENNEDNEVVENDTDDDYFENEDENAEDDTEFSDSEEEVTVFEEEV